MKSNDLIQNHWLYKSLERGLSSKEKISHKVNRGLEITKGDKDKNADLLIRNKIRNTTTVGACTGALSVIPVLGTVAAVVTSLTVEFVYISYKDIELCMEIACNYGFDLDDNTRIYECLAIMGRKKKIISVNDVKAVASNKVLKSVIRKYIRIGILKSLARAAKIIEIKTGLRALTKGVPVIGAATSGAINFAFTQCTGLIAKEYYRSGGLAEGNQEQEGVEKLKSDYK